jgi:hypothetical protein
LIPPDIETISRKRMRESVHDFSGKKIPMGGGLVRLVLACYKLLDAVVV